MHSHVYTNGSIWLYESDITICDHSYMWATPLFYDDIYELTGRTLVPYETHTVSNHTRIIIVSTVPDWRESRKNNDGLRP